MLELNVKMSIIQDTVAGPGTTICTMTTTGGIAPYVYSIFDDVSVRDTYAISGNKVVTTRAINVNEALNFAVHVIDQSDPQDSATSGLMIPIMQAAAQNMFNKTDVIYKITKDINLYGKALTIPANCILDFQGGKFIDGYIVGNNTKIIAGINQIFDYVQLSGTFIVNNSYPEWFRAASSSSATDYIQAIQFALDAFKHINIVTDINLGGETLTIPTGCTLDFQGGSITNGNLIWNKTFLSGNPKMSNINVILEPINGYLINQSIYVDWFGAVGDGITDDSKALVAMSHSVNKKGVTINFGQNKTYLHGDGIVGNTGTGNSYTPASQTFPSNPIEDALHPADIGRDIRLIFGRCNNLTIDGCGSTIISNPSNGECRNNSIFIFGYCNNLTMKNIKINGNKTSRSPKINDYSSSALRFAEDGTIIELPTKGYAIRGNLTICNCSNLNLNNVSSIESMMDGIYITSMSDSIIHSNVNIINCYSGYSYRNGISISSINNASIKNCICEYTGYGTDMSSLGTMPKAGIDIEADHYSSNGVIVETSRFINNVTAGVIFSRNSSNLSVRNSYFEGSGVISVYNENSNDNEVCNCTFYNAECNLSQNNLRVHNNKFTRDKLYPNAARYFTDSDCSMLTRNSYFYDNYIENIIDPDLDLSNGCGMFCFRVSGYCNIINNTFKNLFKGTGFYAVDFKISCLKNNTFIYDSPYISGQGVGFRVILQNNPYSTVNNNDYIQTEPSTGNRFISTIYNLDGNLISLDNVGYGENYIYRKFVGNSKDRWFQIQGALGAPSALEVLVNKNASEFSIKSRRISGPRWSIPIQNNNGDGVDVWTNGSSIYINIKTSLGYFDTTTIKVFSVSRGNDEIKNTILELSDPPTLSGYKKQVIAEAGISTLENYLDFRDSLFYTVSKTPIWKNNGTYYHADGEIAGIARSGTFSNKPIPTNIGFQYFNTDTHKTITWDGTDWLNADGYKSSYKRKGLTSERPTLDSTDVGYQYYDTTLNKYICWNGTAWVNMDGSALA